MKKILPVLVLLIADIANAKTFTYTVTGPLNELKRANIETKLKSKHMNNVSKVAIDPIKSTVSIDAIDNISETDLKAAIAAEGLTVK